jgi:NAD(P)-dependent dehydrogenase (short-subunit alcohol dehydrogenase family)
MDMSPFNLTGKKILVTGASSGIGQAIAVACSRMGAMVVITGRNQSRLESTLAQMSSGEHLIVAAELTESENRESLVAKLPKLDGIVHCAGVGSRVPCKSLDQNSIDSVMKPNFEAPVLLQAAVLSQKKINKGASIVFIASRAALCPSMGNAVYSASKGAIMSYAKCLALELSSKQIRVNCICPAMIWTDLILRDGLSKEEMEVAQLKYPLKRFGQPGDVANLALYLLSDASSWMTGSNIDLSGGGEGTLV